VKSDRRRRKRLFAQADKRRAADAVEQNTGSFILSPDSVADRMTETEPLAFTLVRLPQMFDGAAQSKDAAHFLFKVFRISPNACKSNAWRVVRFCRDDKHMSWWRQTALKFWSAPLRFRQTPGRI